MGKRIDLIDQRFGRLLVLNYAYTDIHGSAIWECLCDCGNTLNVIGHSLRMGRTQSCGCFHKEQHIKTATKHGHAPSSKVSKTYASWAHLCGRCYNKKDRGFPNYGGRGIQICDEWRGEQGFENFLRDMGERPPGKTLDRINNDGNYEPSNCRWATAEEQGNNKRDNKYYCFHEITQTVSQWSALTGIPKSVLYTRIRRWGIIDKVIDTPYVKRIFKKNTI